MFHFERDNHTALKYWLLFGISALALAGLFAILLVAARSPVVQDLIPLNDLFTKSLTVHVNLSVLVWFLSLTCVFWQMAAPGKTVGPDKAILGGAVAGVVLFVLSPFLQEGEALLNNYVPILDNRPFIAGIGLFLAMVLLQAVLTLFRYFTIPAILGPELMLFRRATIVSVLIYIVACVALLLSYRDLADPELGFNSQQFYENLFWGGGHILQYLYAQVMVLAWWWLASFAGFGPKKLRFSATVLSLNFLFALGLLASYAKFPAREPEHILLFTQAMQRYNGVVAVLFGLPLCFWLIRHWRQSWEASCHWLLVWSIIMFGAGGVLGYMIRGTNTIIPAHYHGSIVGITLAMMGVAYTLLPKLGFSSIPQRILTLQAFIYSIGQLMHITGLAWSGGYGALRKTPGAMASLEGQAAMGLMGLGGLLSVIGGILFVVLCARSLLNKARLE